MELDIFVPSLSLALEYHGKQHYEDTMIYGISKMYQGTLFQLTFEIPRVHHLIYSIRTRQRKKKPL